MDSTLVQEYKQARTPVGPEWHEGHMHQWFTPARFALNIARQELALKHAEGESRIRFEWEYQDDYEPDGDGGIMEEETEKLASGEWEVFGCMAFVPSTRTLHNCPSCECGTVDDWDQVASLWGIVVDVDDVHGYKREVERELAYEAGVR